MKLFWNRAGIALSNWVSHPASLVDPLDCVTVKGRCFELKEFPKSLFPPLFGDQIDVDVGCPDAVTEQFSVYFSWSSSYV